MDAVLIISILTVAIQAGTSLVYATIGEIFAERSGILNLGVEGMMIMGAVCAFAGAYHTGSAWVGVAVAIVAGGLLALIHAFLTVSLRSDQVVSGLALTISVPAWPAFWGSAWDLPADRWSDWWAPVSNPSRCLCCPKSL